MEQAAIVMASGWSSAMGGETREGTSWICSEKARGKERRFFVCLFVKFKEREQTLRLFFFYI